MWRSRVALLGSVICEVTPTYHDSIQDPSVGPHYCYTTSHQNCSTSWNIVYWTKVTKTNKNHVISGASINEANVWNKKKQEKGKTPVPASGAFVLCERQTERRPGYRSTDFPSVRHPACLPVAPPGRPACTGRCSRSLTPTHTHPSHWWRASKIKHRGLVLGPKTKRRGPLLPTLYQRL